MDRACIECKAIPKSGSYSIPDGIICISCFNNNDESNVIKPTFTKFVCTVHQCSTYNPGLMASHEMPWCDIVSVQTVGVHKPKTKYNDALGGMNGNIGRHYYRDWTIYCQQKDKMVHAEKAWEKYRATFGRTKKRRRVNANKYKRV